MAFLLATIIECISAIRGFALVLVLAIGAFALTFNLQFGDMQMEDSSEVMVNTSTSHTYGEPGIAGLPRSLWATFLFAVMGDFDGDDFYEAGWAAVTSFVLITLSLNIIMLNVLIAIVGQAQDKVLEEQASTYATLWAQTLFGLDAWFSRHPRQAFPMESGGAVERGSFEEYHNEVQYWCAARLVKWAFKEPPSDDNNSMLRSMPLSEMLGTVHVLSASSHKDNDGSFKWQDDCDAADQDIQWTTHDLHRRQDKMMEEQQKMRGEIAELKGMLGQLLAVQSR
eukprot:SAG31_NODE_2127_length_6390_cov_3.714036_4_plen_282_part_00